MTEAISSAVRLQAGSPKPAVGGDKVKISGLGLPSEMLAYTKNGCAPEFALWSFIDLGYLTYYTAYMLATDALKAEEGAKFKAARMGEFTITKDPTRAKGLRTIEGQVLRENEPMLHMCRELGFEIGEDADAPYVCNVRLML